MKFPSLLISALALMPSVNIIAETPAPTAAINLQFDPADGKGIVAPLPPTSVTINEGSTILLSTTPAIPSRWLKDGIELVATTDGTLQIPVATKSNSGSYVAVATSDSGLIRSGLQSQKLSLEVGPVSQMVNISSRGKVSNPDSPVIVGFVVKGAPTEAKTVLVRVIGKSLSRFGVSKPLNDPVGRIFDSNGAPISIWENYKIKFPTITSPAPDKTLLQSASLAVGAFEVNDEDDNYITFGLLQPGLYTIQAKSRTDQEGEVLVEVYEVK